MNTIRNLIHEILLEDFAGFAKRTQELQYTSDATDPTFEKQKLFKLQAREVKRIWKAEADHEFMRSLIKIHWIKDLKERGSKQINININLLDFLALPRKTRSQ